MHTGLIPPTSAFEKLPAAQALACGIAAHVVDAGTLASGRPWRHRRHDQIAAARHTGWYADCAQDELLTGYVFAYARDPEDLDEETSTTYYALVESNQTDICYLDPGAYDDPLEAAYASDHMAELLAELDRECDQLRNQAAHARNTLAEANQLCREAFTILRHAQTSRADCDTLGPLFQRLYADARAARRRAFDLIDEHRPQCPPALQEEAPLPSRDTSRHDAWCDGWTCAG